MMMRRVVINGQSCIAGLTWSLTEKRSKAEIVSEADGFSDPYDRIIMLELQYGLARTHGKQAWRKTSSLAALLNRGNEASCGRGHLRAVLVGLRCSERHPLRPGGSLLHNER